MSIISFNLKRILIIHWTLRNQSLRYSHLEFTQGWCMKVTYNEQKTSQPFWHLIYKALRMISARHEISLSSEAEKIGEPIVPIVEPVSRSVARLPLLAWVDLLLGRHVLFAAYAEVALDGTTAHRATIEFTKTRSAYAGVPAGQQSARQRKELANDAQLLAGSVP